MKAGSMQASVLTQVSYVNWANPAIVAIVRGVILCHFKDVVFEWKKHSVLSTFLLGDFQFHLTKRRDNNSPAQILYSITKIFY